MGICGNAGTPRHPRPYPDDRAPLRKTCALLLVAGQALTQAIEPLCDLFVWVIGQLRDARIHLDTWHDACLRECLCEWLPCQGLLADRLIAQNGGGNATVQARRGDDQIPVGAAHRYGLRDAQLGETLVTCWVAFVHCQQALAIDRHLVCSHFQLGVIHYLALPSSSDDMIGSGLNHCPSGAISASACWGPQLPRGYGNAGPCSASTGSTTAHAANTASSRVNNEPLPAIASPSSRS